MSSSPSLNTPLLELNLGGVKSTGLVLRPTLSPTDATPSIRIQFAGPGRPQNTTEAYMAVQAIVLEAQAHYEGTSPLSPLLKARRLCHTETQRRPNEGTMQSIQ
jgi:hypothetical protein